MVPRDSVVEPAGPVRDHVEVHPWRDEADTAPALSSPGTAGWASRGSAAAEWHPFEGIASLVGLAATDPVNVAISEDGDAVSSIIAPQHSGSVAGGGQVGPAINLNVD